MIQTGSDDESLSTIWEHLAELRGTLITILLTITAGMCLSMLFYNTLLTWVLKPVGSQAPVSPVSSLQIQTLKRQHIYNGGNQDFVYTPTSGFGFFQIIEKSDGVVEKSEGAYILAPKESITVETVETEETADSHRTPIVLLSPLEGMKTTFKLCFWLGLVGTSPLWSYSLLGFIAPALNKPAKVLALPFICLSMVFLFIGFLFGYSVTLPLANAMLATFNAEIGQNLWSFSSYVDYTLMLLLVNGLLFEMALILFYAVHMGYLSAEIMRTHRKSVILSTFIIGALLTPPDVFSQVAIAVPMIGLYELAILYGKNLKKER